MNDDIQKLIDATIAYERQQCAHHYLKIMRDAVKEARAKERESCARVLETYGTSVALRACAAAIRARGESKSNFKNQMDDNWSGLI